MIWIDLGFCLSHDKREESLFIKPWGSKNESWTIEDQGIGFDHKNIPDPTSPENVEKINGRGIFLMERLSDEILYLEEGRIVELKFKL